MEKAGKSVRTQRYAATMQLRPGCAAEYRRRHDAIWPQLAERLKAAGIEDYSIYLDRQTDRLFAVMRRRSDHDIEVLRGDPLMHRWWAHMSDLMEINADGSPRSTPLEEMFHLE